jgi:lipoprotein-anchoring transpeptidase ErfK/SrfK
VTLDKEVFNFLKKFQKNTSQWPVGPAAEGPNRFWPLLLRKFYSTMTLRRCSLLLSLSIAIVGLCRCTDPVKEKQPSPPTIQYDNFKDSVMHINTPAPAETSNVFDADVFTPGKDSLEQLLVNMDTLLHRQVMLMDYLDTVRGRVRKTPGYTAEEKAALRENMRVLDSFLTVGNVPDTNLCTGRDCMLYLEVDKKSQRLYLYLLGELKDSFAVSTGKGRYETPAMDLRPQGPVVTKYSSRKFPGGNYMRLGNMPYAIFLRNGYAIHGTTPGNFAKLGTRASHGCVRVHPDNAKVLNSLVKTVGLPQTWVSIRDSLQ